MYKIIFYHDKQNHSPVLSFINDLQSKNGKDAKINLSKVHDYIEMLSKHGTYIGEPVCKHLDGEIWELRPLKNRILFAALVDGCFILLHQFPKKTQKTPKREIDKAKREFDDYLERSRNGTF